MYHIKVETAIEQVRIFLNRAQIILKIGKQRCGRLGQAENAEIKA